MRKDILENRQNIRGAISVPTNLEEGELDQKTESHPHFKNYNHSLEMVRKIGLKSSKAVPNEDGYIECGDGIEMGNLTSKDILEN